MKLIANISLGLVQTGATNSKNYKSMNNLDNYPTHIAYFSNDFLQKLYYPQANVHMQSIRQSFSGLVAANIQGVHVTKAKPCMQVFSLILTGQKPEAKLYMVKTIISTRT